MGKVSCLICGRLSEEIFCSDCSETGWVKIHAIQKFLRDYPGLTTIELCRELSVSLGFIKGLAVAGFINMDIPKEEKSADRETGKSSGFRAARRRR